MSELNDFLRLISEAKKSDPVAIKAKEHKEYIQEVVKSDLSSLFAELSSLKIKQKELQEIIEPIVEESKIPAEPVIVTPEVKAKNVMDDVGKYLINKSFQQPNPDKVAPELKAVTDKIKFLEQAIGKIAATGPGSGEVNLRWLDDVDRSTISDGLFLRYNDSKKKMNKYLIFKRIADAKDTVELTAEEITIIKEASGKIHPPLIYGQLCEMFEL
jgi:hypothetical protein